MFHPSSSLLVAALLLSALSAALPESAEAQFAGVPRPPRRRPANVERVATAESGRRDTIPPTRLPDMKAWVDSATVALGATGGPADAPPPGGPPAESGRPPRADGAPARGSDSTMRDGARAPDTATPLPAIALAGALSLAAGLVLRRRASSRPRG